MQTYLRITTIAIFFTVLCAVEAQTDCVPKQTEYGIACVCNATYCDFSGPVEIPSAGQFLHYWSSEAGDRMKKKTGDFTESSTGEAVRVTLNRSESFQKIFGFGGAMTDATTVNIASLSQPAQELLLRSYFSADGSQYSLVRVPLGGSDFSTRVYSYDDDVENDETLEHFNLTVEDFDYKIPYLQRALELHPGRILLFSSPWNSPKWMKTNNQFNGRGFLKTEYYQLWAEYFVKFLRAYSEFGLNFWGVTTQNEPIQGCSRESFDYNCMAWTAEEQRDWVAKNLGPTLESSGFSDVKIFILDDQRQYVVNWTNIVLADDTASKYVAGVAIHWYFDRNVSISALDETHNNWPGFHLLYTEACTGLTHLNEIPMNLGSWVRGESYFKDIIEDMNHWITGWTDWNMVLNTQGGPNWVNNFVDSPIIVNATADEFYKQPMYYALQHFSKFVLEGSTRIGLDVGTLEGTAFTRPDGATVVILVNTESEEVTATIVDAKRGEAVVTLPAKSFHSIIWE